MPGSASPTNKSQGRTSGGTRKKQKQTGKSSQVTPNNDNTSEIVAKSIDIQEGSEVPTLNEAINSDHEFCPQDNVEPQVCMEPHRIQVSYAIDAARKILCPGELFTGNDLRWGAITSREMQVCLVCLTDEKGRDNQLTHHEILSHVYNNHLGGYAALWAQDWCSEYVNENDYGELCYQKPIQPPLVKDFITKFNTRFDVVHNSGLLVTELKSLKQREPLYQYIERCQFLGEAYFCRCEGEEYELRKQIALEYFKDGLYHSYAYLIPESWEDIEKLKPFMAIDKAIIDEYRQWHKHHPGNRGANKGRRGSGSGSGGRRGQSY
ncbi:Tyrosyl-tRNA synthetase [Candida maltosa Xu316]|uniref:Tyrosyl-tRNA synthetase n=1 Tax=Candida maltosa (strain Xu316) TaxID=1245528 RepID=M3K151_CANMX|nr:Tyrosyl-tRNA synthetase [Candida maltosa Xu316]